MEFKCEACGAMLSVPDEMAGKKGKCPHCASIIAAPQAVPVFTAVETPRPAHEAEKVLATWNPSHVSYLGVYVLGALLSIVVIGVVLIIWAVYDRRYTVYTLTDRRIIVRKGIIGKRTSEIRLDDVRNVIVNYGVVERLFGIGTVAVGSAATATVELRLAGVPGPDGVRYAIVQAMERVRNSR